MQILELHTGLFPDAETIARALRTLEGEHRIERIDVSRAEMGDEVWERAVRAILASDLVVTT